MQSLQPDPTSKIMDWKRCTGNAEVKFLMLMLTQAQLNLTCPLYIICLDIHFVMELKIGSIYLYKDDEFVFLLQIHILHAFD